MTVSAGMHGHDSNDKRRCGERQPAQSGERRGPRLLFRSSVRASTTTVSFQSRLLCLNEKDPALCAPSLTWLPPGASLSTMAALSQSRHLSTPLFPLLHPAPLLARANRRPLAAASTFPPVPLLIPSNHCPRLVPSLAHCSTLLISKFIAIVDPSPP